MPLSDNKNQENIEEKVKKSSLELIENAKETD